MIYILSRKMVKEIKEKRSVIETASSKFVFEFSFREARSPMQTPRDLEVIMA